MLLIAKIIRRFRASRRHLHLSRDRSVRRQGHDERRQWVAKDNDLHVAQLSIVAGAKGVLHAPERMCEREICFPPRVWLGTEIRSGAFATHHDPE
jgi:hypothetical protein